jgi:nicotinate-nucleotide adenylyltransferase
MKKIAFYGGSFDPIHIGHLEIARRLIELFGFDEFYFVPAFHAPHKRNKQVSSPFHRYAMLALATMNDSQIKVSNIELEAPERPYTIETLTKLKEFYHGAAQIFFVMGADSWNEIDTWREWQRLLLLTSFVVVTRPNFPIETTHVTPEIAERIVDLRDVKLEEAASKTRGEGIFITDAVSLDVSATSIRQQINSQTGADWRKLVSPFVADYIVKYKLYI